MSEIKQYAVLEYISDKIKNAISDAKLEKQSEKVSIIKDGNDTIHIEQQFDASGNTASILITDKSEILYSENLLEKLQELHVGAESNAGLYAALKAAVVVVNGLSIETEFIFQAVKDSFDTLSNSYEFVKIIEKSINKITIVFKFGNNLFKVFVVNESDVIYISAQFASSADPKIKETIESDVVRVQKALNKLFKEGK